MSAPVVLGSRSPRRRELLALLIGEDRVLVRPPLDPTEPDFAEVSDLEVLRQQLSELARSKADDVIAQLRVDGTLAQAAAVLTADTVIVGTRDDGPPAVLGQPPASEEWPDVVRGWFRQFYIGRTHLAMSAVCVTCPDGQCIEEVVTTTVRFREDAGDWLEWYLSTGEPVGKAGGYGLQGAGSLFVASLDGSPSNVIGLPLRETAGMLRTAGIALRSPS